MINPYFVYISAFLGALLVYKLDWSLMYPELDITLLLFLLVTFSVAFLIGCLINATKYIKYQKIDYNPNVVKITYFISISWIASFIYARGIPFFKIINNEDYDYTQFGIPSYHVFLVTFNSFFVVYLFHMYLSTKRRKVLILYLINLLGSLLIFNRGMLLMCLSSSFFVYLISISQTLKTSIVIKVTLKILPILIIIIFIFGVLGDVRMAQVFASDYSEHIILKIGQAKHSFIESSIPKEFFWFYLYASSPLANLQNNIDNIRHNNIDVINFFEFFNNEILPDFISKRINELLNLEKATFVLIDPNFNVSTVYTGSFFYLSWLGLIFMAIFILGFPLVYMSILSKKNLLNVSGIAILNTLYIFLIFDNMFSFSGLSFQLIYPLLMSKIINPVKINNHNDKDFNNFKIN